MDSIYQPPDILLSDINQSIRNVKNIDQDIVISLLGRIIDEKAKAERALYEAQFRYLVPKSKDQTELDRKVDLDARTKDIKTVFHQLESYHHLFQSILDSA